MNRFDSLISIEDFLAEVTATIEWDNLQDKTQVFNERKEGVKSRGKHCEDVGFISENLVAALGGSELEARRAYLLGIIHDLGHITYGHAGEAVADSVIEDYNFTEEQIAQIMEVRKLLFGEEYVARNNVPRKEGSTKSKNICFEHNENSVLQYVTMCKRFGYEIDRDIIVGILAHSTSRYSNLPPGLAQQAVRIADKLAYINYDVDDLFKSFAGKEEEEKALRELYTDPKIEDPYGDELKINLPDGRSLTVYEFLTQLESKDRIDLFTAATVMDAIQVAQNRPDKFNSYETILTGCNDIIIEMSAQRKIADDENKTPEERENAKENVKRLDMELYRRSPILYAAYKIKERSDEYIRAGKGLSVESQIDRTTNALSAVGNKDLYNEYIYKSIVSNLEEFVNQCSGLSKEQIIEKIQKENVPRKFVDLYIRYLAFKDEQNEVIKNLPGNDKDITYPEIYNIISFVGTHSNTKLTNLAVALGYDKQYEREVLPELQALMANKKNYDKKTGLLTKEGRKAREAIVERYGAVIRLKYGADEDCISPLTPEEIIDLYIQNGFEIEGRREVYADVNEFRRAATRQEQEHIASVVALTKSQIQEVEEYQEEKGRSI